MCRWGGYGHPWADYYIRQGHYESARDVYEEGLTTVVTVSYPLIPP